MSVLICFFEYASNFARERAHLTMFGRQQWINFVKQQRWLFCTNKNRETAQFVRSHFSVSSSMRNPFLDTLPLSIPALLPPMASPVRAVKGIRRGSIDSVGSVVGARRASINSTTGLPSSRGALRSALRSGEPGSPPFTAFTDDALLGGRGMLHNAFIRVFCRVLYNNSTLC